MGALCAEDEANQFIPPVHLVACVNLLYPLVCADKALLVLAQKVSLIVAVNAAQNLA